VILWPNHEGECDDGAISDKKGEKVKLWVTDFGKPDLEFEDPDQVLSIETHEGEKFIVSSQTEQSGKIDGHIYVPLDKVWQIWVEH
jgi:hypothetical protein